MSGAHDTGKGDRDRRKGARGRGYSTTFGRKAKPRSLKIRVVDGETMKIDETNNQERRK